MPSSTPLYGIPFPLDSDPVTDGADAIAALAAKVETLLGRTGLVTINLAAAAQGTQNVVFPVAFAAVPRIALTAVGGTGQNAACYVRATAVTAAGFTAVANHRDGTAVTATVDCHWIARPA